MGTTVGSSDVLRWRSLSSDFSSRGLGAAAGTTRRSFCTRKGLTPISRSASSGGGGEQRHAREPMLRQHGPVRRQALLLQPLQ